MSSSAGADGVVSFFGNAEGVNTGTLGGQFSGEQNGPGGIAINQAGTGGAGSGDVYVVDRGSHRVQQFSASGAFVRAWGQNVVATGPGNGGTNEVQSVTVKAASGSFKLTFSNQTTTPIAYNAPASGPGSVEAALNALSSIGGANGSVSVSGGPGDTTGSTPYVITFGGSLAGTDVAQIGMLGEDLGLPVGTTLTCSSSTAATTTNFRWLANGAPILGATSANYTTVAGDAGKAIQCQVFKLNANAGSTQVSNPRLIASGGPATLPPLSPIGGGGPSPAAPNSAGKSIVCPLQQVSGDSFAAWTGASSFSYQWYRNGVALAGNGANSRFYTLQAADLSSPAVFQCAITGSNAGGSTTKVTPSLATGTPPGAPSPAAPGGNSSSPAVNVAAVSTTATTTPGVSVFEICSAGVDVCKAGEAAVGAGGMSVPQGIAVDQSNGNVYVTDQSNRRVDVYSATGISQGAFGWGVDTGAAAFEFCTTASVCQASAAAGSAAGQFGTSIGYPALAPVGSPNAGDLYVADKANRRIDQFEPTLTGSEVTGMTFVRAWGWGVDTGAAAFEKCTTASTCVAPNTSSPTNSPGQFGASQPQGLAVDSAGNVYAVESAENNRAQKFTPEGDPVPLFASAELNSSPGPADIAVNTTNDHLFVVKPCSSETCPGASLASERRVLELDAAGNLLRTYAANAGIGSGSGLAVNQGSGRTYMTANDGAPGRRGVFVLGTTVNPTVTVEPPSPLAAHSATLKGKVNPNGFSTSYRFEFSRDEGATWENIPAANVNVGNGETDVAAQQEVTGLIGSHEYRYRIVAAKPFGAGTVTSSTQTFTTPASSPTIPHTFSSAVTTTTAVLEARVNPNHQATTYHLEYGPEACASNPCTSIPATDAGIGSGGTDIAAVHEVIGLEPNTTYHFRAVATNPSGTTEGPDVTFHTFPLASLDLGCSNQEFRIGPAAVLPDCRAYEMVSPIDKNGGDVSVGTDQVGNGSKVGSAYRQASVDGGKITYSAATAFPGAVGGHWSNQYISSRESDGWSTNPISAPRNTTVLEPGNPFDPIFNWSVYGVFQEFTPDLSTAWVKDDNVNTLTPDALQGFVNIYRRDNTTDSYEALTNEGPFGTNVRPDLMQNVSAGGPRFYGASVDLRHQVFVVNAPLTTNAPLVTAANQARSQIYDLVDGKLHLVSIMPGGGAWTDHSRVGTAGADSKNLRTRFSSHQNAVSDDGSRIFWTNSINLGQIFMRENSGEEESAYDGNAECTEPEKACTVPISEPIEAGPAQFYGASPDGSEVLLAFGVTTTAGANKRLYRYDVETRTPTLVAGEVWNVPATSDDLSSVYFVSKEALAPGAVAGEYNLYLDRENTKTLVAVVTGEDVAPANQHIGAGNTLSTSLGGGGAQPDPNLNATRTTPDGNHFVFMSNSLALSQAAAGYDNRDAVTGNPDYEVFLYDAGAEDLTCVSCNPSGARPHGSLLRVPYNPVEQAFDKFPHRLAAATLPPAEHDNYASKVLSGDGQRVFFHSDDALLPTDTNGVQDVYQWEAEGKGSCDRDDGCLSLISTGKDSAGSEFVDADPDGEEVFFLTDGDIDPRDPGLRDLYVARVNGGLRLPVSSAVCEGEACQTPPAPPNDPTPASSAFEGAGNVKEKPKAGSCPKGKRKVRRGGQVRCVSRKTTRGHAKRARNANKNRRVAR